MDIISLFQEVCKKYIYNTEDAGCGMRNLNIDNFIIQVYPNNECHNVWLCGDGFDHITTINDYSQKIQLQWLELYYREITKPKTKNNGNDILIGILAGGIELGRIFNVNRAEGEKYIQNEILNWRFEDISDFMQELGLWDKNTFMVTYSPENLGKLTQIGLDNGWDVEVEIERGRDYFLSAKEKKQPNYYSTYEIVGHCDNFEEITSIIDIHSLIGKIMNNMDTMKKFVDFVKKIRKK